MSEQEWVEINGVEYCLRSLMHERTSALKRELLARSQQLTELRTQLEQAQKVVDAAVEWKDAMQAEKQLTRQGHAMFGLIREVEQYQKNAGQAQTGQEQTSER